MMTFNTVLLLAATGLAETTQEPTVLNIIRGQPATITCDYTGSYVQVSWTSDSKTRRRKTPTKTLFLRVNNSEPTSLDPTWTYEPEQSSFGDKSTLTIVKNGIDFGDEGYFDCRDATKTVTGMFQINVISIPQVSLKPEQLSAVENDDSILVATCTAANAKPVAKITWVDKDGNTFDGAEVEQIKLGNVSSTVNRLYLSDVNYDDHAQREFRCLAKQNGQVTANSTWTDPLVVEYGPKDVDIQIASLNATLNETDIFVGDQVILKCNAKSNPLSSFEWFFLDADNQTKTTLEHWLADGDSIQTDSIQISDNMVKFICKSENQHGQQTHQIMLPVKELINEAAGVTGLIWVLLGVTAVLVVIGLCTMLNRHLKQRRSGIYKTEGHLGDGSRESLTDEIGANTKKEYFM